MELALSATTPGLTVGELSALCAFAEDLGYRQAWEAEVAGPDPFVLATAIAIQTKKMEIGVAVTPVYTRSPTALATSALSVSNVLGGRTFRLGLGSSSEVIVSQWHGQEFVDHRRRVRETVEAIRAILNGVNEYEGVTVSMRRFRPAVNAAGPIEIWVAGLRPRMLAIAGAVGDGVCLNLMPPRVVPRQLAAVASGAAEAGRLPPEGVMARLQVLVTEDASGAKDMLRSQFLGPYLAQPVYNRFLGWMGYPEEAKAIAAAWAVRDREALAAAIPDRVVDDLALIGSREAVRARLDEYAGAGVTTAALSVLVPDRMVVEETLRALAP
jgi:probable F420-dependent oxidoreductase